MAFLNYTTTIDSQKSLSEIQYILVKHGAKAILTEYGNRQEIIGISFQIETPNGLRGIKIPANVNAVLKILEREKRAGKIKGKIDYTQAERVAFRVLKDWVEAQMAILETEMVEMEQVFLPFMIGKEGQTFFDLYKNNQLMLESKIDNQ